MLCGFCFSLLWSRTLLRHQKCCKRMSGLAIALTALWHAGRWAGPPPARSATAADSPVAGQHHLGARIVVVFLQLSSASRVVLSPRARLVLLLRDYYRNHAARHVASLPATARVPNLVFLDSKWRTWHGFADICCVCVCIDCIGGIQRCAAAGDDDTLVSILYICRGFGALLQYK